MPMDNRMLAALHILTKHEKLSRYAGKFVDVKAGTIKGASFKRAAAPWSHSEKVMLNLALHLFNERNKVDLSDFDYLDARNTELALEAIKMRYGKAY